MRSSDRWRGWRPVRAWTASVTWGGGVLAEHGEDGDDVGGHPVGQAGLAEPVEGGGVGDGDELDRAAGRLRQLGGDVVEGDQLGTGQLVGPALVAVAGQHGGGGRGHVGRVDHRDLDALGRSEDGAGRPDRPGEGEQVGHVVARAQDDRRDPRGAQVLLDPGVPVPEVDRRPDPGPEGGQLDQPAHASPGGGVDQVGLVGDLGRQVAAGQEDALDPFQRRLDGGRVGQVADGQLDLRPEGGGRPVRVADEGPHRHAAAGQLLDDPRPDVPGRAGHQHLGHRAQLLASAQPRPRLGGMLAFMRKKLAGS